MKDSDQIQLRESKLSFKLTVKKDLEYKIRTLCSNISSIEWSGILFYRPKGDLDKGTFEVECVDLFLMDIGSSAFTEFETSPEIAAYISDNLDLFDCQTGLIHSHNTMSTFFSGTDNKTLLEQGQENNHFLSLIVNNEGSYTAAITRQVISEYTVNENRSYKSFGDKIFRSKNKSKGERMFIEKIKADITIEAGYDFSERIKQIKDSKTKVIQTKSSYQKTLFDNDYFNMDEAFAKREYDKKQGWQHGYYQNYGKQSTTKTSENALKVYEDVFEYDIVMEILDVTDPLKDVFAQLEDADKRFTELSVSNQDFKEAVIESLNYYSANYNLDFKLMNDIVDLLPDNRLVRTFKSVIADE